MASLLFAYEWFFLPALAIVCVGLAFHRRTAARLVAGLGGLLVLFGRVIQYFAQTKATFFAGDMAAVVGALVILGGIAIWWATDRQLSPNTTPRADARDIPERASNFGARAGGRER